jgi:leader peptidase (prepilin peptidase)/N-methyltransferase
MRRRPVIFAGIGAIAFLLASGGGGPLVLARLGICGAALAAAAATDLAEHRIPNRLVLPAAIVCAALSIAAGASTVGLLAGAGAVAVLLVVALGWPRALGMGDVKLALLVLAGLDGATGRAIALGLILAALAGIWLIVRFGRSAGKRSLPLAPFIAAGSLLALLA